MADAAPAPTGLGGLFSGYDLGSRLMAAGSYVSGDSAAGSNIMNNMYERQKTKAQDARTQSLIDSYLAKNPGMGPLLAANPELIYKIMEQDRAEEIDKANLAESRGYTERTKRSDIEAARVAAAQLAETNAANSPEAQYARNFTSSVLPNAAAQVPMSPQMALPGAQGPIRPTETMPGDPNITLKAIGQQFGLDSIQPGEANRILQAVPGGAQDVEGVVKSIIDDRRQAENSKYETVFVPDPVTGVLTGKQVLKGGGAVKEPEDVRRGKSLLAGARTALEEVDKNFDAYANSWSNTIGGDLANNQVGGLTGALANLAGQGAMVYGGGQPTFNALNQVAQNVTYALSGAAAPVAEKQQNLDNIMPHGYDSAETRVYKKSVARDYKLTLLARAAVGLPEVETRDDVPEADKARILAAKEQLRKELGVEAPKKPDGMVEKGDIQDGYRFKGGDQYDENNWEPVE